MVIRTGSVQPSTSGTQGKTPVNVREKMANVRTYGKMKWFCIAETQGTT